MDVDTKHIRGLQYLLSIFGCDLNFSSNKLFKIFLKLIKLIWFLFLIDNLRFGLMTSFTFSIKFFVLHQPEFNNFIFYGFLWIKCGKIADLTTHFISSISAYDKRRISRRSYLTLLTLIHPLILIVTGAIYYKLVILTYIYIMKWNMNDNFIYYGAIIHKMATLLIISWASFAASTYLFVLYGYIICQKNILNDMLNMLRINDKNFIQNLDKMFKNYSKFENLMNFLPLIQLIDLFETFSRIIEWSRSMKIFVVYIKLSTDTLSSLILICLIRLLSKNMKHFVAKVRIELNSYPNVDVNTKMFVNVNLDKYSNLKFTAFRMFNLEPHLILSFTSALITYTILFLTSVAKD